MKKGTTNERWSGSGREGRRKREVKARRMFLFMGRGKKRAVIFKWGEEGGVGVGDVTSEEEIFEKKNDHVGTTRVLTQGKGEVRFGSTHKEKTGSCTFRLGRT